MASEDNEPVLRAMFSSSALDFNFTYAGISGCSASNNLKRMHLKEDNQKGHENKELHRGSRGIYIGLRNTLVAPILHVELVHHKLVYTKFIHPGLERMRIKPYFCSSHCQSSWVKIDLNRFCSSTSVLKKQGETPTCPVVESWY